MEERDLPEGTPRPIVATVVRKRKVVDVRRYAYLNNAIKRMSELAMLELEPKDVVEFSHNDTGLQMGTLKVGIGELKANWIWD